MKQMANFNSIAKPSHSTCGIGSLALPLMVAVAGYVAIRRIPEGDSGSLALFVFAGYSLVASMIAGIIIAILGHNPA
jgi:hypothetical protein